MSESAFNDLKKSIENFLESISEINEIMFKGLVSHIFAELPEIESFRFTGYTPSFNDGEECTFTLTTDYCDVTLKDKTKKLEESKYQKTISKYLDLLPESFYRDHFGNNVAVTVTATDVTVEDYDCGY